MEEKSLVEQLIITVRKGINILDKESRQELIQFLKTSHSDNGLFNDRAGNPDMYYSLFGTFIAMALDGDYQNKIQKNTFDNNRYLKNYIDHCTQLLLKIISGRQARFTPMEQCKLLTIPQRNISLQYRLFLMALLLDASKNVTHLHKSVGRIILRFFSIKNHLPSSILSATLVAQHYIEKPNDQLNITILKRLNEDGGFRTFTNSNADILSTGVSLFALQYANHDLRLIKTECINYIVSNYSNGAFLSGDGDQTRDVEYTFYGLLALGSLSS